MNLGNIVRQFGSSWSCKRTIYIHCRNFISARVPSNAPFNCSRRTKLDLKVSVNGTRQNGFNNRRKRNIYEHSQYLVFGGILSFFGLDEDAKKERKYDREIESTEEESFDDKLKNILRPAIYSMQQGEYEKAEKIFHIALRMAQDVEHQDAILYIHDLLANLAYIMEDYTKAEKLFVDVMQRQIGQKGVAQDDNSIVAMSLKLAEIFWKTDQHEKAQQGFEFCIDTAEKKIKAGDRDEDTMVIWGMSRDAYAQYLMSTGRHQRARDQFTQAYDMCCKVNGEMDEQSLVLLNSLGTVCTTMGDTKAAQQYFQEVIQKARVNQSEHLAHFLVNYGMLNLQMKLYEVAQRNCNEALYLAKKLGDDEALEQSQKCLVLVKEARSQRK